MGGPATSRSARLRLLKLAIGVAALAPAARTALRFFTGGLGANPIAEALNQLGLWTLILLLACLACTPLKIVTGWRWPLRMRRMLGLEAFLYVCLHFTMYFAVDQFFDLGEIWKDIVKRKFITVGFAAFLMLIPLAVTSTSGMVKRLGFPRWKRLHRLVYLAAAGGVIHFAWRVKSDLRQPLIYGFVLAALLAIRVIDRARATPRGRAPSSVPAATGAPSSSSSSSSAPRV
jgi:sulfoxide reductase heme-binding subunit YedZ